MDVRDAVESDADDLAAIADSPIDVMRNLIHDRTVRVVEIDRVDTDEADAEDDADAENDPDLLGFVSFDAKDDTIHVTQLNGTQAACERLLAEPIRFARRERMDVQLMVPETDSEVRTAAERVGFAETGSGPQFDGVATTKYRLDPS